MLLLTSICWSQPAMTQQTKDRGCKHTDKTNYPLTPREAMGCRVSEVLSETNAQRVFFYYFLT